MERLRATREIRLLPNDGAVSSSRSRGMLSEVPKSLPPCTSLAERDAERDAASSASRFFTARRTSLSVTVPTTVVSSGDKPFGVVKPGELSRSKCKRIINSLRLGPLGSRFQKFGVVNIGVSGRVIYAGRRRCTVMSAANGKWFYLLRIQAG